jgi:hypothetical protein
VPKRRSRRTHRGGSPRRAGRTADAHRSPDLFDQVAEALSFGEPLALLPEEHLARLARAELGHAVGGLTVLDELDAEPLPDEPVAWERVPADVRHRVAQVANLADACCDELLDVEHRTAVRRLLVTAAQGDPSVFRRGRSDTVAAAACWLVVKANNGPGGPAPMLKDLMAHFGLTGHPSQRCAALLRAMGLAPDDPIGTGLGSPDYLTSTRRRQLIAERDEACRADR